jgi:hypothetical protein
MVAIACMGHYYFPVIKEIKWYLSGVGYYLVINIVPWVVTLLWLRWATKHLLSVTRIKLVAFVIVEIMFCGIVLYILGRGNNIIDAIYWSTAIPTAFFIWFYKLDQKTTRLLNNEASATI